MRKIRDGNNEPTQQQATSFLTCKSACVETNQLADNLESSISLPNILHKLNHPSVRNQVVHTQQAFRELVVGWIFLLFVVIEANSEHVRTIQRLFPSLTVWIEALLTGIFII